MPIFCVKTVSTAQMVNLHKISKLFKGDTMPIFQLVNSKH